MADKEFEKIKEMLALVNGDKIKECVIIGIAIEGLQEQVARLAKMRSDTIKALRSEGMSLRKIAAALGISATRVEQISK